MRLCVLFRIPTVEEAQERISDEQFWEWMAFDRIDPLPDPWSQHARLCAHIDAVAFGKSKDLREYLPQREEKELTSVEVHRRTRAIDRGNQSR